MQLSKNIHQDKAKFLAMPKNDQQKFFNNLDEKEQFSFFINLNKNEVNQLTSNNKQVRFNDDDLITANKKLESNKEIISDYKREHGNKPQVHNLFRNPKLNPKKEPVTAYISRAEKSALSSLNGPSDVSFNDSHNQKPEVDYSNIQSNRIKMKFMLQDENFDKAWETFNDLNKQDKTQLFKDLEQMNVNPLKEIFKSDKDLSQSQIELVNAFNKKEFRTPDVTTAFIKNENKLIDLAAEGHTQAISDVILGKLKVPNTNEIKDAVFYLSNSKVGSELLHTLSKYDVNLIKKDDDNVDEYGQPRQGSNQKKVFGR